RGRGARRQGRQDAVRRTRRCAAWGDRTAGAPGGVDGRGDPRDAPGAPGSARADVEERVPADPGGGHRDAGLATAVRVAGAAGTRPEPGPPPGRRGPGGLGPGSDRDLGLTLVRG